MKKILFLFVTLFLAGNIFSQEESRLLRFPTMHGNQVVFSYAGDLYTVSLNGGLARKLTNDIGYEMFAHFSPDGKNIAFTAQYDGNTEVYVMPAEGGTPKRLTFTATLGRDDISDRMGPNNIVMAWTNDGKNIIYRSRKQSWDDFVGQLFMVPVEGGLSKELPLSTGGFCSYSPDGKKLAFNRVFREFRTWKYYKGGMADDVRIYDFDTKKITDITNNDNQDIFPMWHGDDIYFCSDRDRTMNLFVYNTKSGTTRKLTNYTDYDIKFPSLGDNGIIFENAGYLSVFDFATQKVTKLSIKIEDDFITGRDKLKDASKFINSADISPDGNRLVMGARGDIFTLPYKDGITRNLTQSPGAHDRDASWSPDGKWIAYLSDKNGEYEIYIQKQDGSEAPIQVTTGADTYKFGLIWSPDSKKILWNDKMLRLQFVDIDSKAVTLVDKSTIWEFASFNWSPDSKWIVYTAPQTNDMSKIILYELSSKTKTDVTDEWYGSDGPAFSADGKYLLFVSQRDFNPIYSQTEWNHAYINMSKVYLATLAKTTPSPFAPENNEVKIDENKTKNEANTENKAKTDKKGGKDKKEKAASANVPDVKIDLDGLKDRIVSLPIDASNYWNLYSNNDKVYYNEMKQGDDGMTFKMFDLKEKKETELGKDMSFTVSANNKKMMIRKSQSYYVVDLPSAPVALKDAVKLSDMKIWVNNREEWNQIYNEAWRQMRDFFYRPTMHGTDWKAMHDKYAVLLPYVNNRHDLNYLIGELIGELNIGHAYVGGGDRPMPERISTGLLGAKLSRDASGYYKIDKILKGANWNNDLRSPLTEMGVDANEGDYIIAINGASTKEMNDIYAQLVNTAGKQVELTINKVPEEKGSHKALVLPISKESDLYYYNWVQNNIKKVSDATNGEVGYIHIPDMGVEGLNEFVKYFYPQLNKKALIIDDRGNGGGNVSPMIIERLSRQLTRSNVARNVTSVSHTPHEMMLGPKVLLVNQYSASDGDLFPYGFKKHKLGKVIGVRTWGGVTGIRGSLPFVDGTSLNKPEFGTYSADESKWIIEGHGVDPDIVVDNDPAIEYQGDDQQLDKAIEVIKDELKNYKPLPEIPEDPDKSK